VRLLAITTLTAYVQIVLGAQLRHIPVTTSPWTFNIWLLLHLGNAIVLGMEVTWVALHLRRLGGGRAVQRPAAVLAGLLATQLFLGGATWVLKYGWPYWFSGFPFAAAHTIEANRLLQTGTATLHVALGSLVLASGVQLMMRLVCLVRAETVSACDGVNSPQKVSS
jgi:cytochrome c oxidase assembly protein subunit 15